MKYLPQPKTLSLELTTEPEWAQDLIRTPTVPDDCCDDYLEYIKQGGEPRLQAKAVRHKLHLIFLRKFRRFTPSFYETVLLKGVRRTNREGVLTTGYRAHLVKVCSFDTDDPEYIGRIVADRQSYRYASASSISEIIGLRSASELARETPIRDSFVYYLLSGVCQYCEALVEPNVLIDSGMCEEAVIADQYRERTLKFMREKHPNLWRERTCF